MKRKNLPDLHLTLAAPLEQLTGALTENNAAFAAISPDRALYTAKKNPVLPFMNVPAGVLGKYTVHFPALAAPNHGYAATKYPQGDGVGQLTITKVGNARIAGTLADGTSFSYTNALSSTNHWPFYVALVGGKASLSGDAVFRDNVALMSDVDGLGMHWFKPAKAGAEFYPDGWAKGIQTDLLGSKFVLPAPSANISLLPVFTPTDADGDANVILTDGNVPIPGITQPFNIAPTNVATEVIPNPANVKLSLPVAVVQPNVRLIASTPAFTGSFIHPTSQARSPYKGVILQRQAKGFGFFLGTSESGAVSTAPK